MENIGLDRHQRESQLCILTDEGEVIERRIRTSPERLTAVLGPRAPARWLLVEAAWRVLRSPRAAAAPLRAWAERIALRRGKRIAVVALARRLAGVL